MHVACNVRIRYLGLEEVNGSFSNVLKSGRTNTTQLLPSYKQDELLKPSLTNFPKEVVIILPTLIFSNDADFSNHRLSDFI